VRLGRAQDEPNAGRRLLEQLQERVERLTRQALGLVEDVDLLAAHGRGGRRAFPELAGVVHASVRRGVDLHDVEVRSIADPHALLALAARLGRRTLLAVDHLRQDPGGGGLAGAPRPREQEGMRETPLVDGSDQGPDHVLLPEHLTRRLGPVLPIERLIFLGHGSFHSTRGK
jgi:hypothetical protein